MELVMRTSDRVIVLDSGRKIAEGPPEAIARDENVIKAYLGERYVQEHGGGVV
jgi:branched-chain amino acid transport system ATP-binding protein